MSDAHGQISLKSTDELLRGAAPDNHLLHLCHQFALPSRLVHPRLRVGVKFLKASGNTLQWLSVL